MPPVMPKCSRGRCENTPVYIPRSPEARATYGVLCSSCLEGEKGNKKGGAAISIEGGTVGYDNPPQ